MELLNLYNPQDAEPDPAQLPATKRFRHMVLSYASVVQLPETLPIPTALPPVMLPFTQPTNFSLLLETEIDLLYERLKHI
jgi:hypothetical protein